MLNKLSLSFYDDTTLRKDKQFILDSPVEYGYNLGLNRTLQANTKKHTLSPGRKGKGSTIDALPLGKEQDEIDFTTTEASKINLLEGKREGSRKGKEDREGSKKGKEKEVGSLSK